MKKNFNSGLNSLIGKPSQEEPKETNDKKSNRGEEEKNSKPTTRATFVVDEEQLNQIKAIAWHDRIQIKDVVYEAFELFLQKHKNLDDKVSMYNR